MSKRTKFAEGDRVKAFGLEGTVITNPTPNPHLIMVQFYSHGGVRELFESDGRYRHWHDTPSLTLVSRLKRKVMKTLELYVNISQHGKISRTYEDDLVAKHERFINGIATAVKLTGTYEVEE